MSFVEFAYNRVMHLTTDFFIFKIVYGFNLLPSMNLILLFKKRINLNGKKKRRQVQIIASLQGLLNYCLNSKLKMEWTWFLLWVHYIMVVLIACYQTS